MKKIQLFVISLTVLLFASCGSSKKTATGEKREPFTPPCEKYTENTINEFRATASAVSPNHQFAKDKALGLARNALAQKIEISVQSLFDNYANQYDIDDEQEFKEKTQSITRQVTDQTLSGLNSICQENFTISSGKYEVWVALEMPIDNVGKSIYNKVI